MKCSVKSVCLAVSLAMLVTMPAQAQEIKKYITPDGKIIYSDEPIPGAREAGSVAPPPPVDPAAREAAEAAARADRERAQESGQRVEEESTSREDLRSAELPL